MSCTLCGCSSLIIRSVDCNLGLVCQLHTYCTSCDAVLKSTYSSERIDGDTSGNVPFVVTRSLVYANMDMGVGHGGLVKQFRHLDMNVTNSTTDSSHVKEVAYANKVAVTPVLDEAVTVIRQTRSALDTLTEEDDIIDLAVSFDGSWMTRGHKSLYGIGCMVDIITGLVIYFVALSMYCYGYACASVRYGGTHTAICCSGRPITETATSTTVALPGDGEGSC